MRPAQQVGVMWRLVAKLALVGTSWWEGSKCDI